MFVPPHLALPDQKRIQWSSLPLAGRGSPSVLVSTLIKHLLCQAALSTGERAMPTLSLMVNSHTIHRAPWVPGEACAEGIMGTERKETHLPQLPSSQEQCRGGYAVLEEMLLLPQAGPLPGLPQTPPPRSAPSTHPSVGGRLKSPSPGSCHLALLPSLPTCGNR